MTNSTWQDIQITNRTGGLIKTVQVQANQIGVLLGTQGVVQTLIPGKHTVVNIWQRLVTNTSRWRVVMLPTTDTAIRIPFPRIQAGDGEWVDIDVLVSLKVQDAARTAVALSDGTGLEERLSAALDATARQAVLAWATNDLSRPETADRLAGALLPVLDAHLSSMGLKLLRIISLTTRPSDEAVEVARKLVELDAALADVDMERQMAALSSKAEWLDFARQLEADYDLPQGYLATALDVMGEAVTAEQLRQAASSTAGLDEVGLRARVQRLAGEISNPPTYTPLWWEPYFPFIRISALIILLIAPVLVIVAPFLPALRGKTAVTVLAIAGPLSLIALGGSIWLEQTVLSKRGALPSPTLLEQMGQHERQRIDSLVREQLAREMKALHDKLVDTQTYAFREGLREESLRLKDAAAAADRIHRDVVAATHGSAAYLNQTAITREQLDQMLRYDEELLAHSATLGDLGEQVRQAVLEADQSALDYIRQLVTATSTLEHQIQARARFIQAPTDIG